MLKIIAGSARGRTIQTLPLHSFVRPILARIKKSLFDILKPYVVDSRFLDLYAGIGTVGLEALSRGASSVIFVEQDPKCVRVIHDNLEELKLEKGTVYRASALDLSFLPKPFDIVFMGPPYKDEGKNPLSLVLPTLEAIQKSGLLSEKGFVIAQHHKKEKTDPDSSWIVTRREVYGDSVLTFYKPVR